jgi:hypothetical protein
MDHPVRTLLYELLVEPLLRLLQRPLRRKVNVPPTKKDMRKAA